MVATVRHGEEECKPKLLTYSRIVYRQIFVRLGLRDTDKRGLQYYESQFSHKEEFPMLWTIVVILLVLWLLGLLGNIGGGLVHLLLVIALVVIVVNLLQGRRAL
jgi:hypothetical protein